MILPLAYITAAWGSGMDFDEKCDTYSRALLEAGYYPICPKAHQSIFLHEDDPREHQLGLDMGQHIPVPAPIPRKSLSPLVRRQRSASTISWTPADWH